MGVPRQPQEHPPKQGDKKKIPPLLQPSFLTKTNSRQQNNHITSLHPPHLDSFEVNSFQVIHTSLSFTIQKVPSLSEIPGTMTFGSGSCRCGTAQDAASGETHTLPESTGASATASGTASWRTYSAPPPETRSATAIAVSAAIAAATARLALTKPREKRRLSE